MPDERMELMCEYLTRVGKEKQAQCNQIYNHVHCTQHPTLPPDQMDTLVRTLIQKTKSRKQLYDNNISFTRHDWRTISRYFNLRFAGSTKWRVLECAMRKERYKYLIALVRERCKAAKEEQPEMGEEYWHWMEV